MTQPPLRPGGLASDTATSLSLYWHETSIPLSASVGEHTVIEISAWHDAVVHIPFERPGASGPGWWMRGRRPAILGHRYRSA